MNAIIILINICIYSIQSLPVSKYLKNPMENPDLFGGDMSGIRFKDLEDRNAIPSDAQRWPGGIIYYTIDKSLDGYIDVIKQSMNHIQQNTCIRFQPRTDQTDYIFFYAGNGCFSNIGRTGGQQPLSLANGCYFLRTAVHEMMHAIGFFHEQNRSDRDNYLIIHLENVFPNSQSQFVLLKPSENRLFQTFDFSSIMLYGNKTFSKNGGITMESKISGKRVVDYPNEQGLSAGDINIINKLYQCK